LDALRRTRIRVVPRRLAVGRGARGEGPWARPARPETASDMAWSTGNGNNKLMQRWQKVPCLRLGAKRCPRNFGRCLPRKPVDRRPGARVLVVRATPDTVRDVEVATQERSHIPASCVSFSAGAERTRITITKLLSNEYAYPASLPPHSRVILCVTYSPTPTHAPF
jgi:hypothetical protein